MELFKELHRRIKEDASADATSAIAIADVRSRVGIGSKERKKKKHKNPLYKDKGAIFRRVAEDATADATSIATIIPGGAAEFGTETPRIPSEFGDLTGHKSHGMWGGLDDVTFTLLNAFIQGDSLKDHHTPLNKDGLNRKGLTPPGDSTTQDPVAISPFDAWVADGQFIFQDQEKKLSKRDTRAGLVAERERRAASLSLTNILKSTYVKSLRGQNVNDLGIVALPPKAAADQEKASDRSENTKKEEDI